MGHAQHKYKIKQNAMQYNLTGAALLTGDVNMILVEGGPKGKSIFIKGIKQYKKLMLSRIDWNQYTEEGSEPNSCVLVWEGIVQHRSFRNFRLKGCTETEAQAFLDKSESVHYWSSALNHVVETY